MGASAVGSQGESQAAAAAAAATAEEDEMTQTYGSGPYSEPEPTGQVVREQAATVGQSAGQAGGQVARTAMDQGREVVRETRTQARNLVGEAGDELRHQASMQQKRAAEGLRSLGTELRSMAGRGEQQGMAGDLVNDASVRAHQAADWLERREPGQVLDEVRQFARRRPGAFLAGALVAGIVVGRLTRSLATPDESTSTAASAPKPTTTPTVTSAPMTTPTTTPMTTPTAPATGAPTVPPAAGYPPEVQP
jgi:hypothetical protein